MALANFSFRRPLTSYVTVEEWIGRFVRNSAGQRRRAQAATSRYVDLGADRLRHPGFIHLDYWWSRDLDVCWDVSQGLPFADGALQGIFSQHMFEHFDGPVARKIFAECRRVLAPGGTLRIVVPDAERYVRTYLARLEGTGTDAFPYEECDHRLPGYSPLMSVNRVFYLDRDSLFGHRTMYDFALLRSLLALSGFTEIKKCEFGEGRDPALLVDSPERAVESLYVEATAPQ